MNQIRKERPEIMKLIKGPADAIHISFLGTVISSELKAIPPKANNIMR
jgi:hypothetical protein